MSPEDGDPRTDQLGLPPTGQMSQDVPSFHAPFEHDWIYESAISAARGEPLGNGAIQCPGQPVLPSLVTNTAYTSKDPEVSACGKWITLDQQTIPIRMS